MKLCISQTQKRLHLASEVGTLLTITPFMIYVASRRRLPNWVRAGAAFWALFSIVSDGLLVVQKIRGAEGWWGECLSEKQTALHVGGEALGALVGVPFAAHLATRKDLPRWGRRASGAIAVASAVVDGGFFVQNVRKLT
jgi:uncharacterized membrane protein YfcA